MTAREEPKVTADHVTSRVEDHARTSPTPLRRQYLEIKQRFPDEILLFRLGDFYETFDQDAHSLSEALGIVLSKRLTSFHGIALVSTRTACAGWHRRTVNITTRA